MRIDDKTMARRQKPRNRGSWVCEFRGLGTLPILHTRYLDMVARRYHQEKKGERRSAKFEALLAAFEGSNGLVAIQVDRHENDSHSFKKMVGHPTKQRPNRHRRRILVFHSGGPLNGLA